MLCAAVHESFLAQLRRRAVPPGSPLAAPERTYSGNTRKTGFDRCCRKRILRICPSNFDSRRASNAQDRFKKSAPTFRLLRAASIPSTFSTASTQSGHSAEAIYSIIIGLLCTSRQRQWPYRSFCSQSDDCRPSGNWVSSNAVRVGLSHSRAHEGGQLQVAVGRT